MRIYRPLPVWVLAVRTLGAALVAWPLAAPSLAQTGSSQPYHDQSMPAYSLDDLRRAYVLNPSTAAQIATDMERQQDDPARRYGLSLNPETALNVLDSVSESTSGEPFLRGSQIVTGLLDSLRFDYYDAPSKYSPEALAHLTMVSRLTLGTPFLRGNRGLLDRVEADRDRYFMYPDSFGEERIGQLNEIALRVSALPFLQGSPSVVAKLERARMEFDEDPARFSADRLAELNTISMRVSARPFKDPNLLLPAGVAAALLSLTLVGILIRRKHNRERRARIESGGPEQKPITFREACELLGVEPEYTKDELAAAFRITQKKYHPDLVAHLGSEFREIAERKSQRINEAYAVLGERFATNTPG